MPLKFLLDTNILSEPLRARPEPAVMAKLKHHEREICTASIVWHELRYGAVRLPDGARRALIEKYLDDVIGVTLPLLPYDANAAAWHADERARLEKKGRTPPFVDGMIAAVAAVNGLALVTHNTADYAGFADLELLNWHP
ncbi:MAG TPA: type II toxin-antitoxin system VapC family toxin [Myxococcota bacterium]